MSHRALQRVIGTAVTDPQFCTDLLDGKRRSILEPFDLTAEERHILLAIEAGSLQEFAARLEERLETGDQETAERPEPACSRPSPRERCGQDRLGARV
jgi:hypothetical protein